MFAKTVIYYTIFNLVASYICTFYPGWRRNCKTKAVDNQGIIAVLSLLRFTYAAFLWCRIYRVYDFRVGNNVLVTSQLVFTSRELVKKKAARVGEWLATFTLFPLSPVQKAGNNATDRVSCTHYFMSIEIIRCSVRRIKTTKPDKKQSVAKSHCIFSI